MSSLNMNFHTIFVVSIVLFAGSAFSLTCYVCGEEPCESVKELQPQNCSRELLNNVGPGIMNFTQLTLNPDITGAEPPFECQKVEATDSNGKVHVARRCQAKLMNNQSCDHFLRAIGTDREYKNASCTLCFKDACNTAQNVRILSMLLIPTLICSGLFMFVA